MARRRRHRRSDGHGATFGKAIGVGSFALAFLSQISAKDNGLINSQPTAMDKGKALVNSVVGRVTGYSPFATNSNGGALPTPTQTLNPAGIVNKWTGIGIGILILNKVSKSVGMGNIIQNSIGKGFLKGGIVGGFFDDKNPPPQLSNQGPNAGANYFNSTNAARPSNNGLSSNNW